MACTPGDHLLVVDDGRTVGYSVYGDPDGRPVVNCHGGLVSGHDVAPADAVARELGICVISSDRPGVARTDPLPGRGMLPWVGSDVERLIDHLGVDRFGVMGWSAGGQYALAVARGLADRVDRCAVIAGCLPLDDPGVFAGLNRVDRTLVRLARRAPAPARSFFRLTAVLAARWPSALLRTALVGVPPDEADAVRARGDWLPQLMAEGARQPRGAVDEYLTLSDPWGFAPEDVTVPVRVFQGGDDTLVPPAWGETLAGRLPDASYVVYPGEGHFVALTRRREVLAWLAEGDG